MSGPSTLRVNPLRAEKVFIYQNPKSVDGPHT